MVEAVNANAVLEQVLRGIVAQHISIGRVLAHVLKERPEVSAVERVAVPSKSDVVF